MNRAYPACSYVSIRLPTLADALDNMRIDEVALTGGNQHHEEDDGSHHLNLFLREQRIACPTGSAAYETTREGLVLPSGIYTLTRVNHDQATHHK